ncbi:MAG: SUF system Fe-S cluster assembly protein [Hyphomicrobiaceae bacterium]|nr:SUF system Fe-S cluster assembly protein [Hyphomicrobiaceae bacterium]
MTSGSIDRDEIEIEAQPAELRPRDKAARSDDLAESASARAPAQQAAAPEPTLHDFVREAAAAKAAAPSVTEGGTPVEGSALSAEELDELKQGIVMALKSVYDPEIPSDIYELGLIYRIDVADNRDVEIDMTLTAPGCPVAGEMPIWVENAVGAVPGVGGVKVTIVFDPPWDQSRMSDEAKLAVGMF